MTEKTKKGIRRFFKWWILLLLFIFLFIMFYVINFVSTVIKYKNDIENGNIMSSISRSVAGGYSQYNGKFSAKEEGVDRRELELSDRPFLGDPNAMMTIVEFADFSCPNCKIFDLALRNFVKENSTKIKLIFRNFPITDNYLMAQASYCANDQNKFWQMHDKLFSDQSDFSREKINTMAESLGINMDIFSQCIDNGKYNTKISQDLETGLKAGVKGTPTIFVNGSRFQGIVPKDVLQQIFYAVDLENTQNK